jgi:hypothetical protein
MSCSVCYNSFEELVDTDYTSLECTHSFCNDCIQTWIIRLQTSYLPITCPYCRSGISSEIVERFSPVIQTEIIQNPDEQIIINAPILINDETDVNLQRHYRELVRYALWSGTGLIVPRIEDDN